MTYNEIRAEIGNLQDELAKRESIYKDLKWPRILYERFLMAGYTEKDISTPEMQDEIVRKLFKNIDEEMVPWEPKKMRVIHPKYRHPKTGDEWAGRGAFPPRWVMQVMNEKGWSLQQFKDSDEFLIKADEKGQ